MMSIAGKIRKKWILGTLLGILLTFCILVGTVSGWIITGPRSLNSITPYIESALTPAEGYQVKIESLEVRWEGWKNLFGMTIRNLEVINDKGVITAYFPEARVKIYLYKLLIGKIEVKSLELLHPNVVLLQNDDGSFFLASNDKEVHPDRTVSSGIAMVFSDESTSPLRHLQSLIIRNASLTVKNNIAGEFLQSPDASLEIKRHYGRITGHVNVPLSFNHDSGSILAELSMDKHSNNTDIQLLCKKIPTSVLHALLPDKEWLKDINIPLSLALRATADFDGNISKADFVIESGQGSIKYPAQLDDPLNLEHAKITGSVTNNLTALNVTSAKFTFISSESKPFDVTFNGAVTKTGDDYAVEAQAEVANVPVNDVHKYWPISLSPHSRKWVTTHVSNGTLVKANTTLHFKPGELKMANAPEQAVAATITLKGATIKYLPNHPPATDVNGTIKFTGKSMDARVSSAKYMTGTEITQASITMPDMYPDDVRMFIDMDVNAPAKDIASFLALPRVEKAKKLNIIADDMTGQISGNAKLDFIAFSEHDDDKEGDINYTITSTLTNVSQKNFMRNRDIDNANMSLKVSNEGIKLAGNASINQVPMNINLSSSFGKGHDTEYSIKCNMPGKALPHFIPSLDFASGTIGVTAKFNESDTTDTSEARLDLTAAGIDLPSHGITKKIGVPATLDLATEKMASGNTQIKSFTLTGSDMAVSGNAEIEKKSGDIIAIAFDRLHFAKNDLKYLDFRQNEEGIKLAAEGNAFDISPYMNNTPQRKSSGYNINLKVAHLIFGDKREMRDATVLADCGAICRSASMTAKLGDKNSFNYTIRDGKLSASSDNAGELARVTGVLDTAEGGSLLLDGVYKEDKIEGNLVVKNYTVKRAPLLTKILTLASLTGFLDTLSGNGIAFSSLRAPYTWKDGLILLKDGKTHGSAIGLTASGTIDTNNSTLDLNGVVIPSYTMNSLIGNVPIIGNLIMGGKDKGILAINYSIKGGMNDPSVSVNPLSAFTPGFLRGIFDVFDQPAPDIDKIIADKKKEEAKKQAEEKKKEKGPRDPNLPSANMDNNTPQQGQ